jgi:hypothetical protein
MTVVKPVSCTPGRDDGPGGGGHADLALDGGAGDLRDLDDPEVQFIAMFFRCFSTAIKRMINCAQKFKR